MACNHNNLLSVPGREDGWIYFAHASILKRVKIGWAKNYQIRLKQLQAYCPETLQIIGAIPGSTRDEAEIHEKFDHLRTTGEWFQFCQPMWDYVLDLEPRTFWFEPHHHGVADKLISQMLPLLSPEWHHPFLEGYADGEGMPPEVSSHILGIEEMKPLLCEMISVPTLLRNDAAKKRMKSLKATG